MKKLLLLPIFAMAAYMASAADIWVWNNGEYKQMTADSITFAQPSEVVTPDQPEAQDTTTDTPVDTTKSDTAVVVPTDTTQTSSDSTKQDSVAVKPIYGSYSGTLALTVMSMSAGSSSASVTVTEIDENTAKVVFSDFSAMGFTISGFSADSATVSGPDANGAYTLSESNYTTTGTLNGNAGDLTGCNFSGTIDKDGNFTATISLSTSGVPISGKYTGKK